VTDLLVKQQIIDLALNGSGIRDTARALSISTDTVLTELKKRKSTGVSEQPAAGAAERRRHRGGDSPGQRGGA
jgi:InsA-like protein